LIQTCIYPVMPRKAQTSQRFLQGGQSQIFAVLVSSGMWPSYIHLCPKTMTSGIATKSLLAETVALAHQRQCRMQCTSWRCSHMNLQMPELAGMVSNPPSSVLYRVARPLMLQSSINGQATSGISSCRIKVTSLWKIAPALVQPWGRQVSLIALIGD
jgi:hypothetical protein